MAHWYHDGFPASGSTEVLDEVRIQRKIDEWMDGTMPNSTSEPSSRKSSDPLVSQFPPRPNDLGEIEWGRLPTKHEYQFAHRLWSLPNSTLEFVDGEKQENYPEERNRTEEFLTRNVYANLINGLPSHCERPCLPSQVGIEFHNPHAPLDAEGWTYDRLGELAPARRHPAIGEVLVAGKNAKAKWLKQDLKDQLAMRNFGNQPADEKWTVKRLKDELFAYQANLESISDGEVEIYPRHELREWGVEQRRPIDSCADTDYGITGADYLSPFRLYTWALHLSPFNPTYWVSRAYLFHQKGYYDLALGDAYRACYLTEMLHDAAKRAALPGLYARVWDAIEQHVYANAQNARILEGDWNDKAGRRKRADEALTMIRSPNGLIPFVPHLRRTLYHIICLNLLSLQAWTDWQKLEVMAYKLQPPGSEYAKIFLDRIRANWQHAEHRITERTRDPNIWMHESSAGCVSGRAFLQDARDVDRTSETFLATLNAKFFGPWPGKQKRAPVAEVRRKENGELGVFALRAIALEELIHVEEPAVRGQVRGRWAWNTPEGMHLVTPCENCRQPISYDRRSDPVSGIEAEWSRLGEAERDQHPSICRCISVDPCRVFCQTPPPRPAGFGTTGPDMNSQQTTISTGGDGEAAETIAEGSTAQAKRLAGGKRKAKDDNEIDRAPTKRVTRSDNQPAFPSKPKRRTAPKKGKRGARVAPVEVEPAVEEPVVEETRKTCLMKAREGYHYRSCGKAWEWLHAQLSPRVRGYLGGCAEHVNRRFDEHGTILSLMLLDVFDRTLLLRTDEASCHVQPHEVDEMLPLCGGEDLPEQYFPFTYSANIVVPFDVLLNLGVDIFRELDFDTWSIQIVLRKLLLNLVPWDKWRRTANGMESDDRIEGAMSTRAAFETLYVHTGYAMFNHACTDSANAEWLWDEWTADQKPEQKGIPNRIVVTARRNIAVDEEIKFDYYPVLEPVNKQVRLFGRECDCGHCPRYRGGEKYADGKGSEDEWRDNIISDLKHERDPGYQRSRAGG